MGSSEKSKKSRGHRRSHRDTASSSHASGSSTAANHGSSHNSSSHSHQPQEPRHPSSQSNSVPTPDQQELDYYYPMYPNYHDQTSGYQTLPPYDNPLLQSYQVEQPRLWLQPFPGNSVLWMTDGTTSRELMPEEIQIVRCTRTQEELDRILRDFYSHGG